MRLRVTFSKSGALRYSGHLDLQKIWERTARRAGLPLAYTKGFHPGPKIQIAAALPLGLLGRDELVDLRLDEPSPTGPPDRPYAELLQAAAPPGLTVLRVDEVDPRLPSLQTQVASAEYEATLLDPLDEADLTRRLSAVMDAASLPRQRHGKEYDLRPLIETLSLNPSASPAESFTRVLHRGVGMKVLMRLSAREGATGRPEEVLDALGIPPEAARIERTRLILKDDLTSAAHPSGPEIHTT